VLHIRLSLKFMMHYFERKRNEKTYRETIKCLPNFRRSLDPI